MLEFHRRLAMRLTEVSVRAPGRVVGLALLLVVFFAISGLHQVKEVGYSAYFGRSTPSIDRVAEFQRKFQTGLPILVVFGCGEASLCDRIAEPRALEFLGRLQSAIEAGPNVKRTLSLLNVPVVVGELERRTLGTKQPDGSWQLAKDWRGLLDAGRAQGLILSTLLSRDGTTAGLLVELQSIESDPVRDAVHRLFDLRPEFEAELGTTLFMAGEPIYNVNAADLIDRDSLVCTLAIFVVMFLLLGFLFRDVWLTLLPVAAIGPVFVVVQGLSALLSMPVTLVYSALPPVILVTALTASIHLLTAFVHRCETESDPTDALRGAAADIGPACFWASATTIGGFASFLTSDLASFRDFGLLAAIGCALAFLSIFALLPALLHLRTRWRGWQPGARRRPLAREFLSITFEALSKHPRLFFALSLGLFVFACAGLPRVYYEPNNGFSEQSYVIRSSRFIAANLRMPETVEFSVAIPQGTRIYDATSLKLLGDLEERVEAAAQTGRAWSFLDILELAYLVDHGHASTSKAELIASAEREMPIVTELSMSENYWSELTTEKEDGSIAQRDAARVVAGKGWTGSTHHDFTERMRRIVSSLNREYGAYGYEVELEGGVVLLDQFLTGMKSTQWRSFAVAFAIVVATLLFVLWGAEWSLVMWAVLANLLPVVSVLGVMGWMGIGIDPANAMLAAILLVLVVDDTVHIALRYEAERLAGVSIREALETSFAQVGEAVLLSSIVLGIGFLSLLTADWGGLVFFGLLASIGVILALLGDLLLLPSALIATEPGSGRRVI